MENWFYIKRYTNVLRLCILLKLNDAIEKQRFKCGTTSKELTLKELTSKGLTSKGLTSKELTSKELTSKELTLKELTSNPLCLNGKEYLDYDKRVGLI